MIPSFRLVVDGIDISSTVRPRLSTLTLTEKRGEEADQLDLVLTDSDGRLAIPPKGARISLALGYVGRLVDKGSFKVDELEWSGAPDILTIRARSADFTSALSTRRDGSWRDTTLGAVLGDVASRNGLQPRVATGLASIAMPLVTQSRESDLALLRRLGREVDAVATIKEGRLLFARVGAGETATGRPIPSSTITRAAGDRYTWITADRDGGKAEGESRGVRARWRSIEDAQTNTVLVGPADGARRLPRIYATEDAATRAARAAYDRRARKTATFSLTLALGRPDLYPERRLTLSGFKSMVDDATWLIDEVRHQLGAGLTTDLTLESV